MTTRSNSPARKTTQTKAVPAARKDPPVLYDLADLMTTPELKQAFEEGRAAERAARLFREMRTAAALTQRELAKALKVQDSWIAELESGGGSQGPTFRTLDRVATACGYRLTFVPL